MDTEYSETALSQEQNCIAVFAESRQFVDQLVTVKMNPDLVLKFIINCFDCMNEKRGSNLIQST